MRTTIKMTLLIFIALLNGNCNSNQSSKLANHKGNIDVLLPIEFNQKMENQLLIDIRTPKEFEQGHIEGVVNINFYDGNFLNEISKFDKTKPIFIYCRSGNRTSSASEKMAKLGFIKIYDLQGGIKKWQKNKLKIVK